MRPRKAKDKKMRIFLLLPEKAYALIIITASVESARRNGSYQAERKTLWKYLLVRTVE
jgi:hypothetical protein